MVMSMLGVVVREGVKEQEEENIYIIIVLMCERITPCKREIGDNPVRQI